jgi:biotin operon repressor
MLETSARLLRQLSLLQGRRDWTGAELATRLGVTTRTIRNDVERLRGLGYPVDARPGVAGGYRLGTGAAMPPLLLDDEEAVAIAIGVRTAASGSIAGIEETSVRALAKLQQVLPSRLQRHVSAFQSYALPMPARGPQVDPDVLTVIASAYRDHERLRFDYRAHSGAATHRAVEPWSRRGNMAVPGAGDRARACGICAGAGLPIPVEVESLGNDQCAFEPGSDHPQMLALYLGMLDADFSIVDSPELVDARLRESPDSAEYLANIRGQHARDLAVEEALAVHLYDRPHPARTEVPDPGDDVGGAAQPVLRAPVGIGDHPRIEACARHHRETLTVQRSGV